MRWHLREARNAFLGSALGFILGLPFWVILGMWTGGDFVRSVGIVACIWFGITTWVVVIYVWEGRAMLQRLFAARRRRSDLLRSEFEEREPSAH